VIGLGLGLAVALLAAAAIARLRPEPLAPGALAWFGIAPSPVAAGDALGIAGFALALLLLVIERAGRPIDLAIVADVVATGLGAGLAGAWLLARAERAPRRLAGTPRSLVTESDDDDDA
jgi:hypothetical protein